MTAAALRRFLLITGLFLASQSRLSTADFFHAKHIFRQFGGGNIDGLSRQFPGIPAEFV